MAETIEMELSDGTSIFAEVEPVPSVGGFAPVSKGPLEKLSFDSAIKRVQPMAEMIVATFKSLPSQPSEVEFSFGLKLSGELGFLVAKTQTEGNFTLTLKWDNKDRRGKSKDDE